MKLNRIESLLVNNPGRALVQRYYEAPLLRGLAGPLAHSHVLEIGCGRGVGLRLLLNQLGAQSVIGVDLDARQLRRAQQRIMTSNMDAHLALACIERLPFPDDCFDAIADFGALHHVVRWQKGLSEVARVLRPGGIFLFEEVTRAALQRWLYRTLLEHPKENRFTKDDFVSEMARCGIRASSPLRSILGGDIFIGAGKRDTTRGATVSGLVERCSIPGDSVPQSS